MRLIGLHFSSSSLLLFSSLHGATIATVRPPDKRETARWVRLLPSCSCTFSVASPCSLSCSPGSYCMPTFRFRLPRRPLRRPHPHPHQRPRPRYRHYRHPNARKRTMKIQRRRAAPASVFSNDPMMTNTVSSQAPTSWRRSSNGPTSPTSRLDILPSVENTCPVASMASLRRGQRRPGR